jgi:hypothetical protein
MSRISASSTSRPISSETGSGRFVGGWADAGCAGAALAPANSPVLARARPQNVDLAGELVTAPGDRADQVALRPEGLAQHRNLGLQVVLLDDPTGPDASH